VATAHRPACDPARSAQEASSPHGSAGRGVGTANIASDSLAAASAASSSFPPEATEARTRDTRRPALLPQRPRRRVLRLHRQHTLECLHRPHPVPLGHVDLRQRHHRQRRRRRRTHDRGRPDAASRTRVLENGPRTSRVSKRRTPLKRRKRPRRNVTRGSPRY
jgi:hypothetical protein